MGVPKYDLIFNNFPTSNVIITSQHNKNMALFSKNPLMKYIFKDIYIKSMASELPFFVCQDKFDI